MKLAFIYATSYQNAYFDVAMYFTLQITGPQWFYSVSSRVVLGSLDMYISIILLLKYILS